MTLHIALSLSLFLSLSFIHLVVITLPLSCSLLFCFSSLSINVVVAVDMSTHASMNSITNTPSQQIELSQSHTEYEVAIQAVMEILQEYDR